MRTTVDLPPSLHRRVAAHAAANGQSISATLASLVAKAATSLPDGQTVSKDPVTGFPMAVYGEPITATQAARLIEEDA
jgi:hypothetical protein